MKQDDVNSLVAIRDFLIEKFNKCKVYKSNKNAIMREVDHAEIVHKTIVEIDKVLSGYVEFK